MKITYVDHSSFFMELDKVQILFDYIGGELPLIDQTKKLYVLSSHHHPDHYRTEIFEGDIVKGNPVYILSDDIEKPMVPDEFLHDVIFIGPNKTVEISEEVTIHTFLSTDEGVAFLMEIDGQVIYHAGDLNNWYWAGESKEWNVTTQRDYLVQLEKIKEHGLNIDIAFVPVDTRQEEGFCYGINQFVDIVDAKVLIPMHFWGDFGAIPKIINHETSESYRDKIVKITKKEELILDM